MDRSFRKSWLLIPALLLVQGCLVDEKTSKRPLPCTEPWFAYVESVLSSGDGMGHGPDLGSEEWKSVIEFKLGLRGAAQVPNRSSKEWCEFIDARVKASAM